MVLGVCTSGPQGVVAWMGVAASSSSGRARPIAGHLERLAGNTNPMHPAGGRQRCAWVPLRGESHKRLWWGVCSGGVWGCVKFFGVVGCVVVFSFDCGWVLGVWCVCGPVAGF